MMAYIDDLVLVVLIGFLQYYSSISINDKSYLVSREGQLSVLVSFNRDHIELGRHPNDSSISFLPLDQTNSTNQSWNYASLFILQMHIALETIEHVIAIDADRFVYVSTDDMGRYHIGVIELNGSPATAHNSRKSILHN